MKIQPHKVRTSQLYFAGETEEVKNTIVVRVLLPIKRVARHFGFRRDVWNPLEVLQDYGFCQLRVSATSNYVEFVTNIQKLPRTIEALKGYMEANQAIAREHQRKPCFQVALEGSKSMTRRISLTRVAMKLGLRPWSNLPLSDSGHWVI